MQNLIVLLLAMAASGIIGFFLARAKYESQSSDALETLKLEYRRLRQRARVVEERVVRIAHDRGRSRKARQ